MRCPLNFGVLTQETSWKFKYQYRNQKGWQSTATEIKWEKNPAQYQKLKENLGVYFIPTNLEIKEEKNLLKIYNTIRDLEYSFRTLKFDLDLRPIYHKNDDATLAHLHLGLLVGQHDPLSAQE